MRKTFIASLLLVVAILSCSGPTEPTPISSISIAASSTTIASGATLQLTAATLGKDGKALTNRVVMWSSSNTNTATVSATGLVTAGYILGGTNEPVTITAAAEGITGTMTVNVTPSPVATVSLTPATGTIGVGATLQLTATLKDGGGNTLSGRTITWSASDTTVVLVSTSGLVSTKAYLGGATRTSAIIATSETKTASTNVSVTPVPVATAKFTLDSLVTEPGSSAQLELKVQDATGTDLSGRTITWISLDTSIVRVNTSGQVTALMYTGPDVRQTRITATVENRADTITIRVTPLQVAHIMLTVDSVALYGGESQSLSASLRSATGILLSNRIINWQLGDSTYVSITSGSTAIITGRLSRSQQPQFTTLIAIAADKSDTAHITIKPIQKSTVSVSETHACAIDEARQMHCWGNNGEGALGDGTTYTQTTAVRVATGNLWLSVSTGMAGSCAIDTQSELWCWGSNTRGRLGAGISVSSAVPVKVASVERFRAVSVGESHACAISTKHELFCWGWNFDGQLGVGDVADRNTPTKVGIPGKPIVVSVGRWHTCALTESSGAYCWGSNIYGELGFDFDRTRIATPRLVQGSEQQSFIDISAGYFHTCALNDKGKVLCWGWNTSGQLGDGQTESRSAPREIASAQVFREISARNRYSCALAISGTINCWGDNSFGQFGNQSSRSSAAPVPSALGSVIHMSSGGGTSVCAVQSTRALSCWGNNTGGQLGNGKVSMDGRPQNVSTTETFKDISVGNSNVCGVSVTGVGYCWGLGFAANGEHASVPIPKEMLPAVDSIKVGSTGHFCALATGGKVYCWGNNGHGQVGDSTKQSRTVPVQIAFSTEIRTVQVGGSHSCSLNTQGNAFCWGLNTNGQLGDGTKTSRAYPTQVQSTARFMTIATGWNQTCAISTQNELFCWGGWLNSLNEVYRTDLVPVRFFEQAQFKQVSLGNSYGCAETIAGEAVCWGNNSSGTLGNGTRQSSSDYVSIGGSVILNGISTAVFHACGVSQAGLGFCWGDNGYGRAGSQSWGIGLEIPHPINDGVQYKKISAGFFNSCGISTAGTARCWGADTYGQLGRAVAFGNTTPVIGTLNRVFIP